MKIITEDDFYVSYASPKHNLKKDLLESQSLWIFDYLQFCNITLHLVLKIQNNWSLQINANMMVHKSLLIVSKNTTFC